MVFFSSNSRYITLCVAASAYDNTSALTPEQTEWPTFNMPVLNILVRSGI